MLSHQELAAPGSLLLQADHRPNRVPHEIAITFFGPFSWHGIPDAPCVYDAGEATKSGIYLWTVPLPEGYLIYYVGETGRSFETRLRRHCEELLGARYHVYSPAEFARGEKVALWPGMWDANRANRKSDAECRANSSRLSGPIREMMQLLRFFLAPLTCDKRTRHRIEAAIAQPLYTVPGPVGAFQDRGIRYNARLPHEEPIACFIDSRSTFLVSRNGSQPRFRYLPLRWRLITPLLLST